MLVMLVFIYDVIVTLSTIVLYCEVKFSPTRTSNEGIWVWNIRRRQTTQ